MTHLRQRQALDQLRKKLRFSPVVTIQGVRQSGKSTLIREILEPKLYVTLDRVPVREQAQTRTESWLEELKLEAGRFTIAIDEAQKSPALFDQIKFLVDEEKHPGQFILLGSTEFSKEALVKESLTGRVSRLRIFPMTLAETLSMPLVHSQSPSRKELIHFLNRGGFPGMFAIRSGEERIAKLDEWIQVTCERDVLQIKKIKVDPDLCYRIMQIVAHLEEPTQASIANRLNANIRKVEANLKALTQIFALHPITPSSLCTGKTLYFLPDPALATHFKADFHAQLECALLTQFLAEQSYSMKERLQVRYYRNAKGSRAFILEEGVKSIHAYKLTSNEKYDLRDGLILDSIAKVAEKNKISAKKTLIGGFGGPDKDGKKNLLPWEGFF